LLPAFKAGEISFRLEVSSYRKRPVYRLSAEAVSTGRLASIAGIEVRDQFESVFDRTTLRSWRWAKRLREGKRQRDFEMLFEYSPNRFTLHETDPAVSPPRELRREVVSGFEEPLADAASVFYLGRLRPLKPGDRYFINVVDEGHPRRVEVAVVRSETVETSLGKFPALRIHTRGRIFLIGGELRLWYSRDALRIPLKFEADVAFGKIYGSLIQLNAQGVSRGLIRAGQPKR
jgi:hypothetical protein